MCLDRNTLRMPAVGGDIVEAAFEWPVDRKLYGDFWVHIIQPGGQWHGIAFNLYPKGPMMYPRDLLKYSLRFAGI